MLDSGRFGDIFLNVSPETNAVSRSFLSRKPQPGPILDKEHQVKQTAFRDYRLLTVAIGQESEAVMHPSTKAGRHWHPGSEKYTGADRLVAALIDGWEISKVSLQDHWLRGIRKVTVYHFELKRNNETVVMSVTANPYVERFVAQLSRQVLSPLVTED
jgi:hypothetical protein